MSWEDLATDYFEPVCRAAFDSYLAGHGFSVAKSEATSVKYRRGRCWFDIHHYVEESPRFSPMLTLGLDAGRWHWLGRLGGKLGLRSADEPPPEFNAVGLWYVVPDAVPESRYSGWHFSSREDLEQVAPRLRDEVVDRWARPLWDDPVRLCELIRQRYLDYVEERRRDRLPPDPRRGFAILREREHEILRKKAGGA